MNYLITLLVLLLPTLAPAAEWEFSLSSQMGQCASAPYIQMCGENRLTWKVTAEAAYKVSDHVEFVTSLNHFSSFDGKADLVGNHAGQSGSFNFYGAGVRLVW